MPWKPGTKRAWSFYNAAALAAFAALASAGCIDIPVDEDPKEKDPGDDVETENETVVPDPLVFTGTATVGNPLHPAHCLRDGVDGEYHELEEKVDAWRYHLDPDGFAAYWFDDEEEYLEGGSGQGTVPKKAAFAEVCMTHGTKETEYTLTIVHPDHEDA